VRVNAQTGSEVPAGLIAWWPGNHTTEEVVSGRIEPAVNPLYNVGKVGEAYGFDQTSRHVVVSGSGQTNLGAFAEGFTIEMWVQPAVSDGSGKRMLSWTTGTSEQGKIFNIIDRVIFNTGANEWWIAVPIGSWTHVAFAFDKANGRLRTYRNGVLYEDAALSASQASTIGTAFGQGDLYFGGLPFRPSNEWYKGNLDEVSFYKRPLTAAEIAAVYNGAANGKLPLVDNQAPVVSAGPDKVLNGANGTVSLQGSVTDDGKPAGLLEVRWTQIYGPVAATIAAPTEPQTQVTFAQAGLYGFELRANDGLVSKSDVVQVRVNAQTGSEVPAGLIAWWPGNHTTEEVVSGRIEPAVNPLYNAGKVGESFGFDQTSRNIVVSGSAQTNLGAIAEGFTVEMWVQPTSNDGYAKRMLSWTAGTSEQGKILNYVDRVYFNTGANEWAITVPIGSWTHVAFAFDKANGRLRTYRNGVLYEDAALSASQASTIGTAFGQGDLYFGGLPFGTANEWYKGNLDEVSFYKRPLSTAEIAALYNMGIFGKAPPAQPPLVALVSPLQGAGYQVGDTVTVSALTVDRGAPVASVRFYDDNTLLGEVSVPEAIDASLYTFAYTNASFGAHALTAKAIDITGGSTTSSPVTINVIYPPPTVALTQPVDGAQVSANMPVTFSASATYAGGALARVEFYDSALKIGESLVPEPNSNEYRLNFSAGLTPGVHVVSARAVAVDGANRSSGGVSVTSVLSVPTVSLVAPLNGAQLITGNQITLRAQASVSPGTISKVEFYDGALLVGTANAADIGTTDYFSSALNSGLSTGSHTLKAKAFTMAGGWAESAAAVVTVAPYTGPEVVELSSPADDARISSPVEIEGIVARASLSWWKLEYRLVPPVDTPPESAPWSTLATDTGYVGTPVVGATPALPALLATFDPTSLLNGIYEIRLSAKNAEGTILLTPSKTLVVEGNMKIGAFTLAFEDLKVPLGGIPITVTRSYDSRDTREGDFGPGWRIAVNNVRVQRNRDLGTAWWQTEPTGELGFQYFEVLPIAERIVTLTMPDGESHRFRAGAYVRNVGSPNDHTSFAIPAQQGSYRFYPIGDTTSKLEPIKLDAAGEPVLADRFWMQGTGDQDLYVGNYGDTDATGFPEPYNPTKFRLTLADGSVLLLDEKLGLLEMRDMSGNTLKVNRDAQNRVSSLASKQNVQPTPVTTTVIIHRDAAGRVDYIRDPNNQDLDYTYDLEGRLDSFTNREQSVTQFRYENASFPLYLTKILDPRGIAAIRTEFDASGKMLKQVDASGKETIFSRGIDGNGRFERVLDRLGKATTYYYDNRGNVTVKIDPTGAQTSYTYYPDGDRVKFEVDHYGNVTSKAYDARGNVTVETIGANLSEDPTNPVTGHVTRTSYNDRSSPTRITDPDGRVQTFSYDPATNNLLTHTVGAETALAATTTFTYKSDGTIDTITDALGNKTVHVYSHGFNDPAYPGAVKQLTVTNLELQPDSTYVLLRTTKTLLDSQENQLAQIVSRTLLDGTTEDIVTRYRYDAENRLVATLLPDGRVSETRYTSFGKEANSIEWKSVVDYESRDDTRARVTSYDYDTRGNRSVITYPDGSSESETYDAENRRDSSTDRMGRVTRYEYDDVGRLRYTIRPDTTPLNMADNPRTETKYDFIGRVRFQIDESGSTTEYTYVDGNPNAMRRQSMIQHVVQDGVPVELTTSYAYDNAGNIRFVTDPRGNTTETRYDSQGRPMLVVYSATEDQASTQVETQYDALGRRIAIIDQEGMITRSRYDALGRLIEVRKYLNASLGAGDAAFSLAVTDLGVISTSYAYDEAGNQTAQTDALGRTTRYEADAVGRRVHRILPKDATESSSPTETFQYDDWGQLWKRTDFAGKTTTFTYDAMGRLREKVADSNHPSLTYSHAIARVEYDYDAGGARTGSRTYNQSGSLLYSEQTPRDLQGRVDYKDANGTTLDYDYQKNGLLKDVVSSSPRGLNVGYRYDGANRLEYVDDASTGTLHTTTYRYNANGSLDSVIAANQVRHKYAYDALNRLRQLTVSYLPASTTLRVYDYRHRLSGHRERAIESTGRVQVFGYDALYRFTKETITGDPAGHNGVVDYTLDKVGNREARNSAVAALGSQSGRTYNARDWLTGDTYDANGNTTTGMLSMGMANVDVYDFENRLIVRLMQDGASINLSYDADGNRIQKTILGVGAQVVSTTRFLVDANNPTGYAQVVEEKNSTAAGTTFKTYTYGTDLISCSVSANGGTSATSYYVYDGFGSVRALTNEVGALTDEYTFDAFGNLIARTGATDNAYLYRSEQWDADLGLYYNRARYLNPDSGRFWSMDSYEGTSGDPMSLHKYLYANANPVNGRDPSGHWTLNEVMTTVAVIGTLTGIANVGITSMGTSLAMADADGMPDAAIFSASETAATRGVSGSVGFDIIYHFKTGKFYAYVGLSAGLSPLSYFKNFRNSLSPSITGGLIWNMNSADEWAGGGMAATWPASASFLLAKAMGRTNPMWGALSQLAKRETNVKWSDYVVQIGISTSGPAALKFGLRANSFSAEASWAFDPIDLNALGSDVINNLGINVGALKSGNINAIMGELR
jgi:RHS repeat-associated protein